MAAGCDGEALEGAHTDSWKRTLLRPNAEELPHDVMACRIHYRRRIVSVEHGSLQSICLGTGSVSRFEERPEKMTGRDQRQR